MWYQNKDTGHITNDPTNAESLKIEIIDKTETIKRDRPRDSLGKFAKCWPTSEVSMAQIRIGCEGRLYSNENKLENGE